MHAVVTGGAGFIGSNLADALVARGERVTIVDNFASGKRENLDGRATLLEHDIREPFSADADVVFHLAAQADVRVSVEDPGRDADVNVRGTAEVLEAARVCDARVVFSSTGGAIYGEVDVIPSPESTPCAAMAPYGVSKLCGEHYVELSNRLYGTSHVILRYGNVYGPRQDPHGEAGVVAIFFGKLAAGETPLVFGDGLQTRDYVYVRDVVRANLAAFDYAGSAETFNIGTGAETNVLELLQACQHAAGTAAAPEHRPARLGELSRSALDCSLAERELGWKAQVGLAEGLQLTLAELRD